MPRTVANHKKATSHRNKVLSSRTSPDAVSVMCSRPTTRTKLRPGEARALVLNGLELQLLERHSVAVCTPRAVLLQFFT